ncbi:facilitated trehalose transporter Tret1-like [Cimex lectularius]|uniref:Major facilitator superfamily (MFS) profile domain-containing protein n=1 Tax=Cimex lectularius TaxID=79782 RepID=A0A8I6SN33_CIMLE|nr:facilitated trehalose transporter Tret1-like [Cimex lectularius]
MGGTARQYLASTSCCLSVAMTAICFVWLEPLMLSLLGPESEIPMTTSQSSWLVASVEFGEVLVTLPAGILADKWGRKPLLLSTGPMCLVSWVLILATRDLSILFVARIIQGAAVAVVYTVAPMYIAEISEPRIRGELSGHFQTMWYVGILFTYVTGPYLSYQNYTYCCAVIPLIFFATFIIMPESPYYLFMVEKPNEAAKAVRWLRATDDIEDEFESIRYSVQEDMKQKGSWKDLIATKKDRKAFFIVQTVCAIKYLNGMPAVVTYAAQTFASGPIGILSHHELTIILGVLLCVTTFSSAFISDSVGRRPLLIISTLGSVFFNIVVGTYYYLITVANVDVSAYHWIMYMGVAGFCMVSNVGLGPLMQTIQAEFFPSHTRAVGSGVTEITASVATFINLKQFQTITDLCGVYMNFWIFALFGFTGTIIICFVIPETAGKSLGQIQSDFQTEKSNISKKPKTNGIELTKYGNKEYNSSNGVKV